MLYTLSGKLKSKSEDFAVIENGGFGFKVFMNQRTMQSLPTDNVELFVHLHVRENALDLYGFQDEKSRKLFEMLNSVSGIGPKTALGVLDTDTTEKIMAAIIEKKIDFLTKTSGIGRKTAERVILELRNKLSLPRAEALTKTMDVDADVEDALVNLGYPRREVKNALSRLGEKPEKWEERLKETLKFLS